MFIKENLVTHLLPVFKQMLPVFKQMLQYIDYNTKSLADLTIA